jgi:heme exporter protein C
MPISIVMSLVWVPTAEFLGESSRILYFHVPLAFLSVLSFVIAGYQSLITLITNDKMKEREYKAYNAAFAGIFFTILTLITGSIWAKISWGSYWNWDPRESSIVYLMLIYISYFCLYAVLKDNENRYRISSVYLIIAMIVMPFFVFIIPRMYHSLHPNTVINSEGKVHLESAMRFTLFISITIFTLLYVYIYNIMNRISALEIKAEEKNYDI